MKKPIKPYKTFYKENGQNYTFLDEEILHQNLPSPLSYQQFKLPDPYIGFKIREKYPVQQPQQSCKRDYYYLDRSPGRNITPLKLNSLDRFIKVPEYKLIKKGWDYEIQYIQ